VAEKKHEGLSLIQEAIIEKVESSNGVSNAEIAGDLGLQSDYEDRHKNWLSWYFLRLLVSEGKIEKREKLYFGRK